MLLDVDNVTTYYGQVRILEGISLHVDGGELVCLLGGNASGKSTTLKTVLGLVRPRAGRVLLSGEDATRWPVPQRIAGGLASVPENRRLFGDMSVRENLELGAMTTYSELLAGEAARARPILAEVCATIADVQVRNRATVARGSDPSELPSR